MTDLKPVEELTREELCEEIHRCKGRGPEWNQISPPDYTSPALVWGLLTELVANNGIIDTLSKLEWRVRNETVITEEQATILAVAVLRAHVTMTRAKGEKG